MSNSQKLLFQKSLAEIASGGANDAISLLARTLPASVIVAKGSIVEVKFELLTEYNLPPIKVPVAGSEYVREPIQPGDKGILIPCGASISAVSGQGENTADLSVPANLSAFVFMPIGNAKWKSVDAGSLVLSGLTDVLLRNTVHQMKIEDVFLSWNTLIADLNNLLLQIGPLLTTPTVLAPLDPATLNPVKVRQ